ncbi:tetratricopeptide repeat protein [Winogradskyella forsetii]|uniref:tetratricopeptide repeat protein n=1 Tax=Winogradskyella forsetii TaxID=2686077 RepID=UPI0015C11614|nr:hypothetical protein [Winogradskyella forsetii]
MKNEELIALYFEGKLNTSEKARFEDLLQNDANFKAQVTLEEEVKTAIISTKKDDLRQRLQQLEQPKKKSKYYIIAIAASIVIAFGVFGLLQSKETLSNQELYAQYYEPYSNIIAPASRGDELKDEKSKAFRYYDTKDYKTALDKFNSLYDTTQESYYLFYQGVCELELSNTQNAIAIFKSHQNYTDKLFTQSNWYLALAYLKANNTKDAKVLLKTISIEKSYNYKAAQHILKNLK